MRHMFGYGYGHNFGLFGFGWLIMFLVWLLIILGVIVLVKWLVGHDHWEREARKSGNTPLEMLKERYAKGEIGKEEFEQKRKDLV
ncbi:MAG TPA: SHOCT domain-containing protein [Candidatus Bathyarchaeia archaeon]|nr:SHOCT domain-containing protein [Candidatus Bathyarchaeia archaeon]